MPPVGTLLHFALVAGAVTLVQAWREGGSPAASDEARRPVATNGGANMDTWKKPEWTQIAMNAEIGGYSPDDGPDFVEPVKEEPPADGEER